MMRIIDLVHRWAGGIVGLVLAVLGLTGAILVHKEEWIALPHAGDARVSDAAAIADTSARILAAEPEAESIIYASDRFGLHQLRLPDGAAAYYDQSGHLVTRWSSQWERPEVWLFDLHHHLFTGDVGEWVSGIAGLCAVLFVITGAILWWRTRKTFKFRLWPKRMSRPAIVMQHRDLGIVAAPLLLISALTGSMLLFRPVAEVVVAPFSGYGSIAAAFKQPELESGPRAADLDVRAIVLAAHARFPDAQIRILSFPDAPEPGKPGRPITMRMKRAAEWLPNGRSTLWFDAADGRLLYARDALALSAGAQAFNASYPLHAAKVGGLPYRLAMTFSGLAMTILGSFAVWTFWFRRPKPRGR